MPYIMKGGITTPSFVFEKRFKYYIIMNKALTYLTNYFTMKHEI